MRTEFRLKTGLADMLKGGAIMDVTNAEQARIAEDAGAVSVMALERVPADIRRDGGVARMSSPEKIREIIESVSIPVMAKVRIGHFVEAQILQEMGVDFVDESEVLTPADEENHIDKHAFEVPFVCGCRNLGEALRRIGEGAALIRTKGEAGSGNIVEAVRHLRQIGNELRRLTILTDDELMSASKELRAPYEIVRMVARDGRLPVPNFAAGGVATPADAALCMQLGGGVRLRGIRDLQVDGSRAAGEGHREGGDPLPRPGHAGRGLDGPRRTDAGPRHRYHAGGRVAADPRQLNSRVLPGIG